MERYLERKGIKFEDERLNSAIDITSLAKGGEDKMNFLIDNLNEEAIDVINSKQFVMSVPVKNGYTMECLLDDDIDSSFNKSIFFISLIKGDISHDYCFNLYYFHDKCYLSNAICIYNETKKTFNNKGECIAQDPIEGKDVEFSLINKVKNGIFEFQGLCTVYNMDYDKRKKKYLNVEDLLSEFRENLKCREFYKCKDREIYKLYYPNKYKYYTNDEIQLKAAEYHDLICEASDLVYKLNHCGDRFEYESLLSDYKYISKQIEEYDISEISNDYFLYEDWCGYHDVECYSPIPYEEWKEQRNNKVTSIESLPNTTFNKYEAYNPYKDRYIDEEEVIVYEKNRR